MLCLHCLLGVLCLLILKSLSHFEVIFMYGMREYSNFIDLHSAVQVSQHHLLKRLFSILAPFVKKLTVSLTVYFWTLHSVPLIPMSVFVPISCYFDYCSFVVLSEVWEGYASCFVLFPEDCFDNCLLWSHINIRLICSSSVKNVMAS